MRKNNPYLRKMVNMARQASDWKYMALISWATAAYLVYLLVSVSQNAPVRLVPQLNPDREFLTETGGGGKEYLQIVSEYDAILYTTWQPYTVEKQWNKLIRRISPADYGEMRLRLKEEAKRQSEQQVSQVFYQSGPPVVYGERVLFSGELKRYVGAEPVAAGSVYFVFEYNYIGGIPMIKDIKKFENRVKAQSYAEVRTR